MFEDQGYFCVDNLPPEMIAQLVELFRHPGSKVERAAVVCDVRGGSYFTALQRVLEDLQAHGTAHRIVFLRADDDVLVTRYKETRRRHPLAPHGSVADGIAAERRLLAGVEALADTVIDSGGLTVHDLRHRIIAELLPRDAAERMSITFESFGFKRGVVRDADLVFDVRFLPNPHWDPTLRAKNGRDNPEVLAYVEQDGQLAAFYDHLLPLLDFLLPRYAAEGKSHLTIASAAPRQAPLRRDRRTARQALRDERGILGRDAPPRSRARRLNQPPGAPAPLRNASVSPPVEEGSVSWRRRRRRASPDAVIRGLERAGSPPTGRMFRHVS